MRVSYLNGFLSRTYQESLEESQTNFPPNLPTMNDNDERGTRGEREREERSKKGASATNKSPRQAGNQDNSSGLV